MLQLTFAKSAESQINSVVDYVESLNTKGSGLRWYLGFREFIQHYAQSNVSYTLCNFPPFASKKYSCITFNKKWIIAFKIVGNRFRVQKVVLGSSLH